MKCRLSYDKLSIQAIQDYAGLLDDLSASAKRWQEWIAVQRPEEEPLPGAYVFIMVLIAFIISDTKRLYKWHWSWHNVSSNSSASIV